MSYKILKPKKDSLISLTNIYCNNNDACVSFFIRAKWPIGFFCEKCGCHHYYFISSKQALECKHCKKQHYLLAGTIFQDNILPLYKLILGLYLFFSSNKGYTATELRSALDINYKTALRFTTKCRVLMAQSNSERVLDSLFYESDVTYLGSKSNNKQGMATDKQSFLVLLSTKIENQYPTYIKIQPILKDAGEYIKEVVTKVAILGKDRTLSTDGKTTYNSISDKIVWKGEKIDYTDPHHKLYWLNTIWSNIKSQSTGIYHGVPKRSMPLFMQEQEWRFNHRNSGIQIMDKVQKYILQSKPMTEKVIHHVLDISQPLFIKPASEG